MLLVLVLFVILEKQPGVTCTMVGQGTECIDNAVCQNTGTDSKCFCTSDFYNNGGMCVASKLDANSIHLLTEYEGNITFIVSKVPTIVRGNAEHNSWYRGDNESAISRISNI